MPNSLGFRLSRKVFISPWLSQDGFPGYRILGVFFFLYVNCFPLLPLARSLVPWGGLGRVPLVHVVGGAGGGAGSGAGPALALAASLQA